MDFENVPKSPASEAPPEVVAAFMQYVQQNPSLFMGKQVSAKDLKPAPQHMYFRCIHCDGQVLSGMDQCPSCGKATMQTLKRGDLLQGRYIVESQLMRSGGFGNLYSVLDRADGDRPYVMKQLQHRRQVSDKDRALFEREGRLLASFDYHGIPRFQDSFSHDGALYLVLERIWGVTLGQYLKVKGPFSEDQVMALLPQMLEVLNYLHQRSPAVIHRDVKPGNFMLTEDGHLYLIDFGAATDILPRTDAVGATGLPEELTNVFTKGFSAPEVLLGMAPQPASDLYSLGTTLLFLLTGRHPYTHYDAMEGGFHTATLGVSDGLRAVIDRLTAFRVADRYRDAEEVLSDMVERGFIRPNS
jgi:serine/threonine-protein kinase